MADRCANTPSRQGFNWFALCIIILVAFGPTIAVIRVWLHAKSKPFVVYRDYFTLAVFGPERTLSDEAWDTMVVPGGIVHTGGFWDYFLGGIRVGNGQVLVAAGRDCVAVCRCRAPGGQRAGKLRGWFTVPYYQVLALGLAVSVTLAGIGLGGVQLVRYVRRSWICDPGYCPSCRYNLTGNISGICPECGTPIEWQQSWASTSRPAPKA
jgi:hypothetical protein